MADRPRTTSIANKINMNFWLKKLTSYIFIDVFIMGAAFATFMWYCQNHLTQPDNILERYFIRCNTWHIEDICFKVKYIDGTSQVFPAGPALSYFLPAFICLIIFELLGLLGALFHAGEIRKQLKPLNDLAIKTEQISRGNFSDASISDLEVAINHVNVDNPEVHVKSGNSDLTSIEVALNNLLKKMEESKRQQTRFVSDASHELRTPISVIQGYVNMLDRWGKSDPQVLDEAIEALKNESEHMKELIEQLLFLARGDSGRQNLNVVEMDLNEIVTEVYDESLMIDPDHEYKLVVNEMQPCNFTGDIAMVKQSMRILVQNAAKYSGKGDTIKLSAKKETNGVSYIVQDEGIGMTESDVSHIFERFYRSDVARNSESGGSGLGLSIAKWIVDAHRGSIDVLSREDFGTRFTVHFPTDLK